MDCMSFGALDTPQRSLCTMKPFSPVPTAGTTAHPAVAKVPEVTLLFWTLKIAATTLGETGGDAVSMSMSM